MITKMRGWWRPRLWREESGTSLADVMVSLGIISILMGVGVLGLDRDSPDIDAARQSLVSDLRMARMQATLKGVRFRFTVEGSSYRIERLVNVDGSDHWQVDAAYAPKVVTLPSGYGLASTSTSGSATRAEFDGRGLLVAQPDGSVGVISIVIVDDEGHQKLIKLWPSGQVESPATAVAS